MSQSFYCFTTSGRPLSDADRTLLVQTAHEMFRKRKTSQNIGSETMEGLVTTEGQRARLGGVAGVVFEGSIESDEGQFTASFLMADHLLDRRRLPRAVWNKL